jgi:trigger factor
LGRERRENSDPSGSPVLHFLGFLDFWWEQRMTDETRLEGQDPETTSAVTEPDPTAAATITEPITETAADETEAGEEPSEKLHQVVELRDIGPCKKHIKVTVDRADIDALMNQKYSELVVDTPVPGFRPGKAPRRIIERRFHKDVSEKVRGEILLKSLEQLAEENQLTPITAPNIDPSKIEIPKQGPLIYEFEVEVQPEFELPNYKGLKLRRPVKVFTDADVQQEEHRILARYGSLVPKPEGDAQVGDYLITDLTTRDGDRILSTHKEITIRIDPRLALKDGVAERFGEQVKGAKAGDVRIVDITLSDGVADASLRGKKVQARFDVKEIKKMRLPELTHEFLHEFGVHTPEQLREQIRVLLQHRLEYHQRQAARQQILQQVAAATTWDLPEDMLQRQARGALNRRIMEMRSAGMSEDEIRGRLRILEQDVLRSTAWTLKEHFVLQKVADLENLEVTEDDIDYEIERIAAQTNESPRRVRARLEKEDMMDALANEIIERKALDLILGSADYEDVPMVAEEGAVATVEEQAVPGAMRDPTAAPTQTEEKPTEENKTVTEERPSEPQS